MHLVGFDQQTALTTPQLMPLAPKERMLNSQTANNGRTDSMPVICHYEVFVCNCLVGARGERGNNGS